MIAGRYYVAEKPKRTRKVLDWIAARCRAGLCIAEDCDNKQQSCGRCEKCYNRLNYVKRGMTAQEESDFINSLYVDGTYIFPQEVRQYRRAGADFLAAQRVTGKAG